MRLASHRRWRHHPRQRRPRLLRSPCANRHAAQHRCLPRALRAQLASGTPLPTPGQGDECGSLHMGGCRLPHSSPSSLPAPGPSLHQVRPRGLRRGRCGYSGERARPDDPAYFFFGRGFRPAAFDCSLTAGKCRPITKPTKPLSPAKPANMDVVKSLTLLRPLAKLTDLPKFESSHSSMGINITAARRSPRQRSEYLGRAEVWPTVPPPPVPVEPSVGRAVYSRSLVLQALARVQPFCIPLPAKWAHCLLRRLTYGGAIALATSDAGPWLPRANRCVTMVACDRCGLPDHRTDSAGSRL